MFCPNCGAKNEEEAIFCAECGSRIIEEQSQPEQQVQSKMPETGQQAQEKKLVLKKEKFSSKAKKIIGVQIVILAILIGVFIYFGKQSGSPDAVAQQFVKDYDSGKWSKIYSDFDFYAEGPLINKDTFAAAMSNQKKNSLGAPENYQNEGNAYVYSLSNGDDEVKVYIKKSMEKSFFVFDKYEVSKVDDNSISIAQIYVPEFPDVTLKIDGTRLNGSGEETESIFAGNHTVSFENARGLFAKDSFSFQVSADDLVPFNISSIIQYSETSEKDAKKALDDYLEKITEVEIKKESTSSIDSYFISPDKISEYLKILCNTDEGENVKNLGKLTFTSNVAYDEDSENEPRGIPIQVEGKRTYEADGLFLSDEGECQINGKVYMTKKDEKWRIDSITY